MIDAQRLRPLPLLDGLSDHQMDQLAAAGDSVAFRRGDELFQQSAPARYWWLLLEGRIALFRRTGGDEAQVGTMGSPGQWAGGFRAWDDNGVYLATGRAVTAGQLLRVPADRLRALADSWFPLGVHFIRGLVQTVRNIESIARQRESLAALGTLAAGLAHELNNPASAATRAVDALVTTNDDLLASLRWLASSSVTAEHFVALDTLRREQAPAATLTPMELADREDELSDWLADRGIDREWVIAPALAAGGLDVAWCERVAAVLPAAALGPGLEWIAHSRSSALLLGEIKEATGRISALVGAVKAYTHLDRAQIDDVAVADGLDSTLIMLSRDLDGITVRREYDQDVPAVEANAAELNQVWTHLIRNAADAMKGSGELTVRVGRVEEGVLVQIADTGPGMSDAVRAHAFDPFFTTKGVGEGTGLGLDVSRRIVVDSHGGAIDLASGPSGTVARVRLPVRDGAVQPP
ncbi:MAG TPA: ATP-binding protein [Nakamurella sp.]